MRFTVSLPDDLNDWLTEQARLNQRSKNQQLNHILDAARRQAAPREFQVFTGSPADCHGSYHYFRLDVPAEGNECNCGKVRW